MRQRTRLTHPKKSEFCPFKKGKTKENKIRITPVPILHPFPMPVCVERKEEEEEEEKEKEEEEEDEEEGGVSLCYDKQPFLPPLLPLEKEEWKKDL